MIISYITTYARFNVGTHIGTLCHVHVRHTQTVASTAIHLFAKNSATAAQNRTHLITRQGRIG